MDQAAMLRAAEMSDRFMVAMLPYMDREQASEIIDEYANASRDILELDRSTDDYSGIDQLKKFFGQE